MTTRNHGGSGMTSRIFSQAESFGEALEHHHSPASQNLN
jgi:hypothetical protein